MLSTIQQLLLVRVITKYEDKVVNSLYAMVSGVYTIIVGS